MAKKHIDELTLKEIDYAVAVEQGEEWLKSNLCTDFRNNHFIFSEYQPTTNQSQCGELIDKYGISTRLNGMWNAYCGNPQQRIGENDNKSRLVAACKAFLWSKYPDGMMPTEETKNE